MKFDWTINFPFLISTGLGLWGLFMVWLKQRDFNRDVLTLLGKRVPREERTGLLGAVISLEERADLHEEMIDRHHVELGLDRRHRQRRGEIPQ